MNATGGVTKRHGPHLASHHPARCISSQQVPGRLAGRKHKSNPKENAHRVNSPAEIQDQICQGIFPETLPSLQSEQSSSDTVHEIIFSSPDATLPCTCPAPLPTSLALPFPRSGSSTPFSVRVRFLDPFPFPPSPPFPVPSGGPCYPSVDRLELNKQDQSLQFRCNPFLYLCIFLLASVY